jgi:hypothetical protein
LIEKREKKLRKRAALEEKQRSSVEMMEQNGTPGGIKVRFESGSISVKKA